MVSRKQYVLDTRRVALAGVIAVVLGLLAEAQSTGGTTKFYPDDPLWREPEPRTTSQVAVRKVDDLYDFGENRFVTPRGQEKARKQTPIPAGNINTLGEVPDSNWYTNRHSLRRMSVAELQRGPGKATPPDPNGAWQIVGAKSNGVTPGIVIEDRQTHRYVLKFDPPDFPELASAADVIFSKFFYALGYNTPENYIVHFRRENLTLGKGIIIAFSDEEIRAIVETGEFTDNRTAEWITDCLIKRRDKIARTWLRKLLPFDRFRVEDGMLAFDDLSWIYRLFQPHSYDVRWYSYDNDHGILQPLPNAIGTKIPAANGGVGYMAAVLKCTLAEGHCRKPVTVFVRFSGATFEVVGVARSSTDLEQREAGLRHE
ncbi:MAG: hypothetical protein DMG13_27015 [Acidobacteria bacterium]|nr:MAG: hypothetical protein DMG13_27015 [Acidobacteriota bacterium]